MIWELCDFLDIYFGWQEKNAQGSVNFGDPESSCFVRQQYHPLSHSDAPLAHILFLNTAFQAKLPSVHSRVYIYF